MLINSNASRELWKNPFPVFFLATLLFLSCLANGETSESERTTSKMSEQIHTLIEDYAQQNLFSGTALVAHKGEVIYERGHGLANREWNIPNTQEVKFRLASMTKQFTSMLIMQLAAEHKLGLDDAVSKHLPGYPDSNNHSEKTEMTIHHLLTHTSGIANYPEVPGWFEGRFKKPTSKKEFFHILTEMKLLFEPGERYRYSNAGYFLLGAIIESVTGESYEHVIQTKILDPLAMTETGYDHHNKIIEKRASGYQIDVNGDYQNSFYIDMSLFDAAAALYSTVGDLYLWDRALYSQDLLSDAHKKIMFAPYIGNIAYGWETTRSQLPGNLSPITINTYGGEIVGFNSRITRFVEDEHLVVLLHNSDASDLAAITRDIMKILYGLSP